MVLRSLGRPVPRLTEEPNLLSNQDRPFYFYMYRRRESSEGLRQGISTGVRVVCVCVLQVLNQNFLPL